MSVKWKFSDGTRVRGVTLFIRVGRSALANSSLCILHRDDVAKVNKSANRTLLTCVGSKFAHRGKVCSATQKEGLWFFAQFYNASDFLVEIFA